MGVSSWDSDGYGKSPDVLLVTRDPDDVRSVSSCLRRHGLSLAVARDGRAAIELLSVGSADGPDGRLPSLVVVDLGVESVAAETVLDAIKSSPRLRTVPVVVLCGGEGGFDVERAYGLGANGHVARSDDAERYGAALERLASFWFDWATLPPECLYRDGR